MATAVGVRVGDGVGVSTGVGVRVGDGVGVSTGVDVRVGTGIGDGVEVGTGVGVRVGKAGVLAIVGVASAIVSTTAGPNVLVGASAIASMGANAAGGVVGTAVDRPIVTNPLLKATTTSVIIAAMAPIPAAHFHGNARRKDVGICVP